MRKSKFITVTDYNTNKKVIMNVDSISMVDTNSNDIVRITCAGIVIPVKEEMEEIEGILIV